MNDFQQVHNRFLPEGKFKDCDEILKKNTNVKTISSESHWKATGKKSSN